ncbi:tetratricopeptide repeat protein [Geobacter pickeringii]|uniref:tetratricopeptide repeat protein n=1 Tax=Geobacter pickeringii TaxID=345632 RepID=UPI001F29C23E|nr:tetratricopeptide repeat protein [Geobacter pickeringii]
MENETESFWTDIKRYEDVLAKDANSYCFAPLAELYRKVGHLDDAMNTARKGIELHPEYVGGYMALGRACFEKGEKVESRRALERVVRVTPDNLMAQKLLSQLYIDAGETESARASLETILVLNPGDLESTVALEALTRSTLQEYQPDAELFSRDADGEGDAAGSGAEFEDEFLLEEAEIVEELTDEFFDGDLPVAGGVSEEAAPTGEDAGGVTEGGNPLATATIAELYVSQGFLKKALKIYRDLSDANPDNEELRGRLVELKLRIDEDEARARENALAETVAFPFSPDGEAASLESPAELPQETAGKDAITVLEGWLTKIGRIRECRSGKR